MPNLKLKGYNIYEVHDTLTGLPDYSRKDFYKICLYEGKSTIHYADRSVTIDGQYLFFGNPHIPYDWIAETSRYNSFTCIFTDVFLSGNNRVENLQHSPFFKVAGTPIFPLNEKAYQVIKAIFLKMVEEEKSDYRYKKELIRSYISLIVHEAYKLHPPENFFTATNAPSRISMLFLELLERQFPVENPNKSLAAKNPAAFAERLNITINHLNRSVKQKTGKTTQAHINERIAAEAKILLEQTNWPISKIAYTLGFKYPTYFGNFFKKITGKVPTSFRTSKNA